MRPFRLLADLWRSCLDTFSMNRESEALRDLQQRYPFGCALSIWSEPAYVVGWDEPAEGELFLILNRHKPFQGEPMFAEENFRALAAHYEAGALTNREPDVEMLRRMAGMRGMAVGWGEKIEVGGLTPELARHHAQLRDLSEQRNVASFQVAGESEWEERLRARMVAAQSFGVAAQSPLRLLRESVPVGSRITVNGRIAWVRDHTEHGGGLAVVATHTDPSAAGDGVVLETFTVCVGHFGVIERA